MIGSARHVPLDGLVRLLVLHARSRNLPTNLAAIILVSSLYLVLRQWASFDQAGEWGGGEVFKQFTVPQVVPALLASIIGMAVWSPFGEPERTSATSLTRLRGGYLGTLLLVAVGLSLWLLGGWDSRQEDINLPVVALRNLLGMTGMALLAGRCIDARLTWLVPVCWSMLAVMLAIRQGTGDVWKAPFWLWSGQSGSNTVSWVAAGLLFLLGASTFLRWGPMDTASEA